MQGVINVLKPANMTSHDVVNIIRRITNQKKVGHTGTLDPMAVGVLPICIGSATKLSEYLAGGIKKYRAEITLGITSDTGDITGNILNKIDIKNLINIQDFSEKIKSTLNAFKGKISQKPPMYSAVKVNGKKLYELARKGVEINRESREIEIFDIELFAFDYENSTIIIDVLCSKGTYIRVLAEDIGKMLGACGCLSYLIRTESCGFKIENSNTLEELFKISEENCLRDVCISVEEIYKEYPSYEIKKDFQKKLFLNGNEIDFENCDMLNEKYRIYIDNKFIALGIKTLNQKLKVDNFFMCEEFS